MPPPPPPPGPNVRPVGAELAEEGQHDDAVGSASVGNQCGLWGACATMDGSSTLEIQSLMQRVSHHAVEEREEQPVEMAGG
jgi:hypothetical protein